jgi:chromosome segregation ATPase
MKQERIEQFENEDQQMKDQKREATRRLKEYGFEIEDLQGQLADPNTSEEDRERIQERLDEVNGDKEHWKHKGEEAGTRMKEMVAEKVRFEKEEA